MLFATSRPTSCGPRAQETSINRFKSVPLSCGQCLYDTTSQTTLKPLTRSCRTPLIITTSGLGLPPRVGQPASLRQRAALVDRYFRVVSIRPTNASLAVCRIINKAFFFESCSLADPAWCQTTASSAGVTMSFWLTFDVLEMQ